ncbi:MAG: cytochrome c biogenesis protein CcsA [Mediterranea sp.]|jgi:ABC-type transport system involved in cytochrome c biogenesis permease subunit|nr:cytochrome c biogenesis protein CcsA [Mediterranea sp.]
MKYGILKKCVCGVLTVILVLLALATLFEKWYGSEWALKNIYESWWMVTLWCILAIASFTYILHKRLYRQPATFLLHCAFVVILAGAFVTFLTAGRGYIHLRQGETLTGYISDKDATEQALPFRIKLVLFDIEYHSGTYEPADYISFLKLDDRICRVSMNRIQSYHNYRLYQMSYDPDEMGSTLGVTHDPWGIGITYAGYMLLAFSMLWIIWIKTGWRGIVCTAIPVAGLWYYISQLNPMTPVLRSPMLAAHVSVIMISYGLLIFMTITSMIGLCSEKQSKRFYRWNTTLLYPALFLLATGIFIGAVWANISWGRYWGWDAKETWALITLLIYAIPFHRASLPVFRTPKKFHWFCVAALLTVAMTFFGVTYFLGGMHSYVD